MWTTVSFFDLFSQAIAWSRWPPTSSQAAIHKAGAVFLGAAKTKRCMGSKTASGGRIGMAFLRWASMSASMEAHHSLVTVATDELARGDAQGGGGVSRGGEDQVVHGLENNLWRPDWDGLLEMGLDVGLYGSPVRLVVGHGDRHGSIR
ncbi:hypothetical protein L1049_000331 [Liquidambar formosana]|uniref:Uncharacterized protein n=1 Tax=Liquidambar formosana TaxID=63359 RepID=A0AAP0N8L1_LIQFO